MFCANAVENLEVRTGRASQITTIISCLNNVFINDGKYRAPLLSIYGLCVQIIITDLEILVKTIPVRAGQPALD
jgi:hypothetical protein